MLKPSCWCMQSFLPLPYPFPWCLMPLSHPGGTFLVCPSLPVDFSPAPCGWVAVAQSVSAAMCKPCSASCAQGKLKSWGGTLRDSFAFQDLKLVGSLTISSLNFPLLLHLLSYEALVFNLDNPLPAFPWPSKTGRTNTMLISYPGIHILVQYWNPSYVPASRIMTVDELHRG